MNYLPKNKKIILFDGVCNLCNNMIQFIIKRDKKDQFRFVSLQSNLGQEIVNYLNIDIKKIDSIILYEPNIAYYYKSEAVLKIIQYLGGKIAILTVFYLLPIGFNNKIYDYIAKNRYKWYGKKECVIIPSIDLKDKFLQ